MRSRLPAACVSAALGLLGADGLGGPARAQTPLPPRTPVPSQTPVPGDTVRSLSSTAAGAARVTAVSLLGHGESLAFVQDTDGLHVTLPPAPVGEHAFAFKITR